MTTSVRSHEPWVLAATILAASMVFIDGSALNVALPAIQSGLRASAGELLWIVNAYLLVLAALILLGGALGDRFGRRRVYRIGIVVFSAGSLWCGLAPDPASMIAARVFQGLGGALLIPGSLALLSAETAPERRGRAIGLWSAVTTMVTVVGPLLGGALADAGFWRAVFWINPPLGALALGLLVRVPADQPQPAAGVDLAGSLLAALGLGTLTWGAQSLPERGFNDPVSWVCLGAGAVALAAVVVVERRTKYPLVPWSLFRSPVFSGTNLLTLLLYGALNVMGVFLSLNLVQVQGYSKLAAGLALLPVAICMAVLSRPAGAWADRWGTRRFLVGGPSLVAVGFGLLAFVGETSGPWGYGAFLPGIVVFGLGMALTVAPLSAAVMGSVPTERSGTASGVNNAVSRIGGVLALAVLGAMALWMFPIEWRDRLSVLALSPEQRQELLSQAPRLAGVQVPPTYDGATTAAVTETVHTAFLSVWRTVLLACAGLAAGAATAASWFLRGERRPTGT